MANHLSAWKRIRQNEKRAARNKARLSRIRTFLRKFEEAVQSGNKEGVALAFRQVQSEICRGARRGVMHANAASRKISRLHIRMKALDLSS
ncbi:MAG: 30S ribosomal protein S20 [Holosporales bacterium]|jgi:small subunit ribosomal protein S20|nr:30S ribosomal protein S20 [Holosporales bacterium]